METSESGSVVAAYFNAMLVVVVAFKAPSREPVSELHHWLAEALDSLKPENPPGDLTMLYSGQHHSQSKQ